jgi:rhodanese-related sulfurtransferase
MEQSYLLHMRTLIILIGLLAASAAAFAGGRTQSAPTIAQGQAKNDFAARSLSTDELAGLIGQPNLYLIDVRTAEEYRGGAIPSAINIPYDVIQDNLPTQDRSARIVVYCRSGSRSGKAKATLEALGFQNVNNFGPVTNWKGKLIVR